MSQNISFVYKCNKDDLTYYRGSKEKQKTTKNSRV